MVGGFAGDHFKESNMLFNIYLNIIRLRGIKICLLISPLLFSLSCNQKNEQTIVQWMIYDEIIGSQSFAIDTISIKPYKLSSLEFILKMDSLLKTIQFENKLVKQELRKDGYNISLSPSFDFQSKVYSKVYIYHHDWPLDAGFIHTKENGIIAFLPSHSSQYFYLNMKKFGQDTTFFLSDPLLDFFQTNDEFNNIPAIPDSLSNSTEILDQIILYNEMN